MKKLFVIILILATIIAGCSKSPSSNVVGEWSINGKRTEIKFLNANSVYLINERGEQTEALIKDLTLTTVKGGEVNGVLSPDHKKIVWSNGTEWTR